jgi:hypothetical protein
MADIKFACPHCQQHLQADSGYGGVQINCPACNGALIVPGTAAAPPPPAPAPYSAPPPAPPAPAAGQLSIKRQEPSAPNPAGASCPSCGAAMPMGAILCTQCGYNKSTGRKPVAAGQAKAAARDEWYLKPYPYVGALVVVLAVLYFLGRENNAMMLAFAGVALIYTLGVHIVVLVAAFRDNVGTGFLTLCLPFYALYFVFRVHDNATLKLLYAVAVILNILLRVIPLGN